MPVAMLDGNVINLKFTLLAKISRSPNIMVFKTNDMQKKKNNNMQQKFCYKHVE